MSAMRIALDDLSGEKIRSLLREHLDDMHRQSPPESVHALDVAALRKPGITFWTAWSGTELLGCGALKEIGPRHGEIKSMRTVCNQRRRGVARAILEHILAEARRRVYDRLSLETGSQTAFAPARRLYETFGFVRCAPFADYIDDPNSVFLSRSVPALRRACLIDHREGKLLLVRARDHRHWYLPGGKIESDESAEPALRRELADELGIELADDSPRHLFSVVGPAYGEAGDVELICFAGRWTGEPRACGEISEVRWIDLSETHRFAPAVRLLVSTHFERETASGD